VFRSDLCVHKVIKGWSSFRAAWFTDIDILEEVYRATKDSAGIVHAIEGPVIHENSTSTGRKRSLSIPHLTNDHYSIVMQPVGLSGADAKPQDEAQLGSSWLPTWFRSSAQGDLVHVWVCVLVRAYVCLSVCVYLCVCAVCTGACHLHQLREP